MKYKKIATMVLMCLMCTAVQAGGAICPAANSFCTPDITQKTQGPVRTNTESDSIDDEEDIVIPETFDITKRTPKVDVPEDTERHDEEDLVDNADSDSDSNRSTFFSADEKAVLALPENPFTSMYSDYDSEADEPDYLALGGDIT
jgi:hypothetical protein